MDDATQKHRDSDWSALAAVDLSLVSPDTRDDDWLYAPFEKASEASGKTPEQDVHALDWISADEVSETAKNTAVAGAEAGDGDQHSQNLLQILYDQYVAGLKIPPAPVSQNASPQKTHGSPRRQSKQPFLGPSSASFTERQSRGSSPMPLPVYSIKQKGSSLMDLSPSPSIEANSPARHGTLRRERSLSRIPAPRSAAASPVKGSSPAPPSPAPAPLRRATSVRTVGERVVGERVAGRGVVGSEDSPASPVIASGLSRRASLSRLPLRKGASHGSLL